MMSPSDHTIELRLAALIEGQFLDVETEADLRRLGISPDDFRELCRERIELFAMISERLMEEEEGHA
jgi:hypothetical protein